MTRPPPSAIDGREMAEVVGCELGLPAGPDPGLRTRHDPGVVDHQVDRPAGCDEASGERVDTRQIAEVQLVDLDAIDAGQSVDGDCRPSCRDDDVGADPHERSGGLDADARVAAGDDGQLA
jgi:hypothetical protein